MKTHPIKRYCKKHDMTQSEFAVKVGYTRQFISALILGRERCGASAALTISKKTKGAITIQELISRRLAKAA
jgi:DNA-binding XRE family transcriptional regulator